MKKFFFNHTQYAMKAFGFFLFLFLATGVKAQIPTCTEGCTAKDIKIERSFLTYNAPSDPNHGQEINQSFNCNSGETISAKLNVTLSTNTPRKGLTLYGYLLEAGDDPLAIGECFPVEFTKEITAVTVQFSNPIEWTCGANLELKDIVVAWGTGQSQWCTGSAPQCPGTNSKCWKQGPSEYIPVVNFPCSNPTITNQPGNQTKCAGESATFSFTFNQGSPEAAIQWQLSTNGGSTWSNLNNVAPYSGVNTTTLNISSTTISMNGNRYKAVLTNSTDNNICGSQTNGNATLTVYNIPAAPGVNVVNNCNGTSTLTVTGLDQGATIAWQDIVSSANPRIVSIGGTYSVTQTLNGCTSGSGSGTANPKTTPDAPNVEVVNNCNGTSILTATNYTGSLLWSTGATTQSITVNTAGIRTVTQTVSGCTSGQGSGNAAPGSAPSAPNVTYTAPACDQNTFSVSVTNVFSGATYTIKDKTGANIPGISPGNSVVAPNTNNITFSNIPAGSGYQVTATVGLCTSSANQCGGSQGPPEVSQLASKEVFVEMPADEPVVKAYPNPFRTSVTFKMVSPVSGRASLDVYNASGQRIGNAFNGVLQANLPVTTEFKLAQPTHGMLFYRMVLEGKAVTGKLMSIQ